jgi:methylglutaconyl-CoA hydratase
MSATTELKFVALAPAGKSATGPAPAPVVALLELCRPAAANAFDDVMIHELVAQLRTVAATPGCRALVLSGRGRHFSAGADLAWMRASAQLSYDDNVRDAARLIELFETLAGLPLPTLAVVRGSAFGGAVGLTACCDVAIAAESARFCLSEIKLGLLPAVILPYLARKLRPGTLRRLALTGRVFTAADALAAGLIERAVPEAALEDAARDELSGFLQGAPAAQAALKALLHRVVADSSRQDQYTAEAIAAARTGVSGQAGLAAFFAKAPAPWSLALDPALRLAPPGSDPHSPENLVR